MGLALGDPCRTAPAEGAPRPSASFDELVAAVAACRCCPRMEGRRRLLSSANGAPGASVLFVAEAPGRLGGDRTGIPLSTDQTGRNFSALLAGIGWSRDHVFITNAILCNPRDPAGRNARPTLAEVSNCTGWLRAQIEAIDPRFVVTLGAVALDALRRIEPHPFTLRAHVAQAGSWYGRRLIPLYHPGAQAQMTRPAAQQRLDWQALRRIIGPPPDA